VVVLRSFILLSFSTKAGRLKAAGTAIYTPYVGILAGGYFPLPIEPTTGEKGTDSDNRPDNN
jgi:hypothetical protein